MTLPMQRIDGTAGNCERGGAGGVEVEEESVVEVVGEGFEGWRRWMKVLVGNVLKVTGTTNLY
jgi:hypothetical protein